MDDLILITELNDFIFCPVSIYFHKLYGDMDRMIYQSSDQINGTSAHDAIDGGTYSKDSSILMGMDIYCEEYGIIGKIDIYDKKRKILRERKKKVNTIYDGYVFQIYAQYFALKEMGYEVNALEIYSIDDNKVYKIELPENNPIMIAKFKSTVEAMRSFALDGFVQENIAKCERCIYEPACDRSLKEYA